MVLICGFLFQAKQIGHRGIVSEDVEIVNFAKANVGPQAKIKGGEAVNVF